MHTSHPGTEVRRGRQIPPWQKAAILVLRWSVRGWVVASSLLFALMHVIFIRSMVAADRWSYVSEGPGEIDVFYEQGRISANFLASDRTNWLNPGELCFLPGKGHFPLDAYWQADHVLGVMWQISSLLPALGVISLPIVYLFVFFALAPAAWVAQRLFREKRVFPPLRTIPRGILVAAPWVSALGFYLLAMLLVYGERNQITSIYTREGSAVAGLGRADWQLMAWRSEQGYGPDRVFLRWSWTRSHAWRWAGFERHVYIDDGVECYRAVAVPAWLPLGVLAVWPALALGRGWRNWRKSRTQHSFPVT